MTSEFSHGQRWRSLTPEQATEVCRSVAGGVRAADLAKVYGVSVRTIYRTVRRGPERMTVVTVFDHQATFVADEEGTPVRMTPWYPAETGL